MPGSYLSEYKVHITKVNEFRKNDAKKLLFFHLSLSPESDKTHRFYKYRQLSLCSPFYVCGVFLHILINPM